MNMYLQSDKEISFVLQKIPYKKLCNLIEFGIVHKLHHTDILNPSPQFTFSQAFLITP